jgi:ethanolamine utilization protein EutP (predicted NTPase)
MLLVLSRAGWGLALDQDACVQILRESGFLPKGPIGVVNFLDLPEDLSAEDLRKFLRENGADICGIRGVQDDVGRPSGAAR